MFFFFKQKTAYEIRPRDWSSDVCSSDLLHDATALPAVEVATLLGDVSDVLAAVHKVGVVHLDLKPDNVLCTPTDLQYTIRVVDWGVARMGPIGRLTIDGLTAGTPVYMSPEQASGHDIGAPCDIYSLGVMAYEALTGRPPFDGRTLAEVVYMHLTCAPAPLQGRCGAPAELCNLVAAMLHKEPSARPTAIDVRQVARAIARDMSQAYEDFEVTHDAIPISPSELEYGVTEMLPVVRQPRWTPEIGGLPGVLTEQRRIGPRAPRDQVAGEIIVQKLR